MRSCLLLLALAGFVQEPSGPLVVFNAGSLATSMRDLFAAFREGHPEVDVRDESSGSLTAARKLTEFDKIPDLLAVADGAVIDELLVPRFTTWYAEFASNAMAVVYTEQSRGASEIDASNWMDVLQRDGVRVGRSDPTQDPAGYRALMVYQLAERHYRRPGLATRLLAASPERYTRPKSVELLALLQTGHLDYALLYRTEALATGLRRIDLPPEIDLSDPARNDIYRTAEVTVPRSGRRDAGQIHLRGEAIAYAVTIPDRAPNPVAARAFLRFMLGSRGRAILSKRGFVVPARPRIVGDTAAAGRAAGSARSGAAPGAPLR